MSEEPMSRALDAIHDETEKLLLLELPSDVRRGLEVIISLARYQLDVRGNSESQPENQRAT